MNCLTCIFCERPGAFEPCRTCLALGDYPKHCATEKQKPQESNNQAPARRLADIEFREEGPIFHPTGAFR
jgi:hypothetical protein